MSEEHDGGNWWALDANGYRILTHPVVLAWQTGQAVPWWRPIECPEDMPTNAEEEGWLMGRPLVWLPEEEDADSACDAGTATDDEVKRAQEGWARAARHDAMTRPREDDFDF